VSPRRRPVLPAEVVERVADIHQPLDIWQTVIRMKADTAGKRNRFISKLSRVVP
jgi:hypothetical protein